MRIWIDTEFNEYQGALISMALVNESGLEWYEVLECTDPKPWVAQHVMPVLNRQPIGKTAFGISLQRFLMEFPRVHLVADWPDDIRLFCEALVTGPGLRLNTPPLMMEIRRDLNSEKSATPHNALCDARALRACDLGR